MNTASCSVNSALGSTLCLSTDGKARRCANASGFNSQCCLISRRWEAGQNLGTALYNCRATVCVLSTEVSGRQTNAVFKRVPLSSWHCNFRVSTGWACTSVDVPPRDLWHVRKVNTGAQAQHSCSTSICLETGILHC